MTNQRTGVAHSRAMTSRIALAALPLIVASFLGSAPAEADQPPPKCRVVSQTTTVESKLVVIEGRNGRRQLVEYVRGVTTTVERCRGELHTDVTRSAWTLAPAEGPR